MALRQLKNEVILDNHALVGANGTVNGEWRFNFSGTGGAITEAAVSGGGFDLDVGAGEDGICEIVGPLIYEVDDGLPISVSCDVMVETDASAKAAVFVGLTDRNDATEEIPVEDEDGTLETDATDTVGMMLEREQDATWQAVSSANGTDGAQTALTDLPDVADDTWAHLEVRIEENEDGAAETRFFLNGKQASHTRTGAVTSSIRLAPVVTLDARNAAVTVRVRNLKASGAGANGTD